MNDKFYENHVLWQASLVNDLVNRLEKLLVNSLLNHIGILVRFK